MTNKPIVDLLQVGPRDVFTEEDGTLQQQNAVLREDNEDLRASALWWKTLYEEAQRRCTELDSMSTSQMNPLLDVRVRMRASTAARRAL